MKWLIGAGVVVLAALAYFAFRKGKLTAATPRPPVSPVNPYPEGSPENPHVVTDAENAEFAAGGGGTFGAIFRNLDKLGVFDLPGYTPPTPPTPPTAAPVTEPVGASSPAPIEWRASTTSTPLVNVSAGTISWRGLPT